MINFFHFSLVEKIKSLDTMIILGETGCGKTTQIPKYILEYNINKNGLVVVTQVLLEQIFSFATIFYANYFPIVDRSFQPRRIATVSIAQRVSEELHRPCGETVGYKIRFQNVVGPFSKLIYATDGTLLREAVNGDNNFVIAWAFLKSV